MSRRFYRIVERNPPTREDFIPKPPRSMPRNPEKARLFSGLSFYDSFELALRTAREHPRLGAYIVAVVVEDDGLIQYERTTQSAGHYTLWGNPDDLLRCVIAVTFIAPLR